MALWSAHVYTVDRIVAGVFFYIHGETRRYRKYELQLVSAPADDSDGDEADLEHKYDDSANEKSDDDDDDYARQRKLERRLAREGMAPHRYSDDADNSYEHRYQDELADLPERRRGG